MPPTGPFPSTRSRTSALRWIAAGMAVCMMSASAARGAPKVERRYSGEVADLYVHFAGEYNERSRFPLPELDGDQIEDLLAGEVVRLRWKQPVPGEGPEGEEPKERHRVVALYLIERPMTHVWLSAFDEHMIASDRVTEVRWKDEGGGSSTWYQFMDLPWPIENRHWVIDVAKSKDTARETNGDVWEGTWSLVADGERIALELAKSGRTKPISLGDVESAVYLEANTGAWCTFRLSPNLTLLGYQLTVVLGGLIPEGLAAKFAMRELEKLCRTVEENAVKFPEHYDAAHEPIYGGDGLAIPRFEGAP